MAKPDQTTALVGLRSAALPKQKTLVAELRRRFEEASLGSDLQRDGDRLTFTLGDGQATIELVSQPIPWSELEEACVTAWWWPEAVEAMQGHAAHLVVSLAIDDASPLERFILLTHLTAAAAAGDAAVGVCWPMGGLVHSAADFCSYSDEVSPASIVPQLWINMQFVEGDRETLGLATTGLAALGRLEIEIQPSTKAPEDLLDLCGDVVSFMLTSGRDFETGETFGRTEDETVEIARGASQTGGGAKVLKLTIV